MNVQKNIVKIFLSILIMNQAWGTTSAPQSSHSGLAPLYSFVQFVEHAIFGSPLLLLAPTKKSPVAIVMDLGEVACTTDEKKFLSHIGVSLFIKAGMLNKKKFRALLFDILHEAKPLEKEYGEFTQPTDETGMPLPQLMIDWMAGNITSQTMIEIVQTYLDTNPKRLAKNKRKLVEATLHTMTTTQTFIETRKLYTDALIFAQECKERGYELYVLSNWPATKQELQEHFPEFFNICDGIMLSGDVHLLKPDPALYQHFLDTFHLQAKHTIFIDDQYINIKGAQHVGMHALLCTKHGNSPDFRKIRQKINMLVTTFLDSIHFARPEGLAKHSPRTD